MADTHAAGWLWEVCVRNERTEEIRLVTVQAGSAVGAKYEAVVQLFRDHGWRSCVALNAEELLTRACVVCGQPMAFAGHTEGRAVPVGDTVVEHRPRQRWHCTHCKLTEQVEAPA